MIVTCPECRSKISEEARVCPACGLPDAGRRSKEHCERIAQMYGGKEVEMQVSGRCKCGFSHMKGVPKVEIEEGKYGVGYSVTFWFFCSKCGGQAYRHWEF